FQDVSDRTRAANIFGCAINCIAKLPCETRNVHQLAEVCRCDPDHFRALHAHPLYVRCRSFPAVRPPEPSGREFFPRVEGFEPYLPLPNLGQRAGVEPALPFDALIAANPATFIKRAVIRPLRSSAPA